MTNWTAGCRISEARGAETIPVLALYPSAGAERPVRLGPYTLNVAMDARAAGGPFPLVLVSHGTGGSHLLYRTLGEHLARHGFVVVSLEHPRNNRNNNELGGTAEILANRPRHVRQVMDWAFSDEGFGALLEPDAAAVVGHSLGGYTALALAGGSPASFPRESADGLARPVEVTPDARVKALVLLAPATPWLMAPGALSAVRVPILMLTGGQDAHTPAFHGEIVKRGVPDPARVVHIVTPGAGHFSFLSPFPAEMVNPAFAPSQDPPGFDRAGFHEEMNGEILGFLQRALRGLPLR